jgi:hypothetical protein
VSEPAITPGQMGAILGGAPAYRLGVAFRRFILMAMEDNAGRWRGLDAPEQARQCERDAEQHRRALAVMAGERR